ncbi:MAG: hypothetical protein ACP5NV_02240 [Candidatus Woesearchaeota archaeon]
MNLFKSTKHEVYKNLAEGFVASVMEYSKANIDINTRCLDRNGSKTMFDYIQEGTNKNLDIITTYKRDVPIILEYIGDSFLKIGHSETAFYFYNKVHSKKANILRKFFPEYSNEELTDYGSKNSINKKLDEIMANYEKSQNPNIPFIPPIFT